MINGVPACVFYVDENGHGLAFSSPAQTEQQLQKWAKNADKDKTMFLMQQYAKMQGKRARIYLDKGAYINWDKYKAAEKDKSVTKHWDAVSKRLGSDGEKNQNVIATYCDDHSVDMETYFPAQYFASKLGEGWFIPSDDELEKLSLFFYGHYGENDKCNIKDFDLTKDPNSVIRLNVKKVDKNDDLSNVPVSKWVVYDVKDELNKHLLPQHKGIVSSRMRSGETGFQALHPWETEGMKRLAYIHINDGIKGKNTLTYNFIVPVYRF